MLSNGIKAALNWINFDSVLSDLTKISILFRHDIDILQIFLMIPGSILKFFALTRLRNTFGLSVWEKVLKRTCSGAGMWQIHFKGN